MTALLPFPELQFLDNNGAPLAAGTIATYIPGTFTPKPTWQDESQITANTNPIVLDAAGRAIVYGAGSYRFVVCDHLGNQIYDQLSSSSLSESAISAAMLPVVGAATIATADALLGIPELIQAAISNIELMPGPTGPTGVGIAGPTGPAGPTGSVSGQILAANPGYWRDPGTGFTVAFGEANTVGSLAYVTLPRTFTWVASAVCVTIGSSLNIITRMTAMTNTQLAFYSEDSNNNPRDAIFNWIAVGLS